MTIQDELLGLLFIDVYQSTEVKRGEQQCDVTATFNAFHKKVDETFGGCGGQRRHSMGDGAIFIFPNSPSAVRGALRFLAELPAFDTSENRLRSSLHVRIGIHEVSRAAVANAAPEDLGRTAVHEFDVAGNLEKNCPVGKIALSDAVFNRLDPVHAALFRQPAIRPLASAPVFILDRRNPTPRERELSSGLSEDQIVCLPPIPFRDWQRLRPQAGTGLRDLEHILQEPFLVVLGESSRDPGSPVQAAATSDAVGITEILAVLRSNAGVITGLDRWMDTADFACNRTLVLVGSGIVNSYAFAFNDVVGPVRFAKSEGRIIDEIMVQTNEGIRRYGAHALPPRDSGFVVLSRSPVNPKMHVVWIAGITGMGTQAAARFVWELVQDARATLMARLGSLSGSPIACVVTASTPSGCTDTTAYYRRWRVADYIVLLAVDSDGRVLYSNDLAQQQHAADGTARRR